MSAKRIRILLFTTFVLTGVLPAMGQEPVVDTLGEASDFILQSPGDSMEIVMSDSMPNFTNSAARESEARAVDAPVKYTATDSIIYGVENQVVHLYGEARIEYRTITLQADYIRFDMGTEVVIAMGRKDSTGEEFGKPNFTEGDENFDCERIRYNFRTKKGIITNIYTEQEGGYLHSETTKRHPNEHIHMRHGKYTTCDAPHPHFYIALTRAKSIPDDKIISGPAYFVIEDVPIPIGIPFGFFPSNQVNQSGFLLPTYGEEERRGFFFRNGGFYFALSKYFDFAVTGDIYTNGTWGLKTRSNYRLNYKFSGTMGFNYFENIVGEKGLDNYRKTKNIAIQWSHRQAAQANPNQTLSASVNYSSTQYDQFHNRNINNALRGTKRSSVSYSRRFPNSPFNLSAGMNATQNALTQTVDMNLPTANLSMNRVYPLKRKSGGRTRWYEKLQLSYSANIQNKLNAKEDSLIQKTTFSDFDNGYQHNIPISLPLNFLNYFTLSPSARYSGTLFTKAINPRYLSGDLNPSGSGRDTLMVDTVSALNYAHAFVPSVGLSFTPKIFGMYEFREDSRVVAIRHVMSPSMGLSLVPDMQGMVPDYYQEVEIDTLGNSRIFPKYDESIFSTPVPSGRSGSITFNLKNNFEAKVRSRNDTVDELEKVKLLDNLNFNTSYNMFADSMKWTPIRMSGNTALWDRKISLRFSGIFSPYAFVTDSLGRNYNINRSYLGSGGGLARFTNFDFSVGMRFSDKGGERSDQSGQMDLANDPTANLINPTGFDEVNYSAYEDVGFSNWSLNLDYNFRYSKPFDEGTIIQTLRVRGDFNLTPKWEIGANTGYDFKLNKITTTNFTIRRDLHCWEMRVSMVPFGKFRSYSFQINIKSAILKDLQYEKGDTWYDNF